MEISKLQLEILASHIVKDLKCDCGIKFGNHFNEPCTCGWTYIKEFFQDELNMELKIYPEALKYFYKEYETNINLKGGNNVKYNF